MTYHASLTVKISGAIRLEGVMNAEATSMVKIVIYPVLITVLVNVIETLGTVQVAKRDTMALGVNPHVLSPVMEVAVKTPDVATANLDPGGINVKIHVQVTVQMMNVRKKQATAVVVNQSTGVVHVTRIVQLTV